MLFQWTNIFLSDTAQLYLFLKGKLSNFTPEIQINLGIQHIICSEAHLFALQVVASSTETDIMKIIGDDRLSSRLQQ